MKKKRPNKGRLIVLMAAVLCILAAFASQAHAAFQYDAHGRRDPFIPLVGVGALGSGGGDLGNVLSIDDVVLQGVLVSGEGDRSAIINGEIVVEGHSVGKLTLEKVDKNGIRVRIDDGIYEIKLYE